MIENHRHTLSLIDGVPHFRVIPLEGLPAKLWLGPSGTVHSFSKVNADSGGEWQSWLSIQDGPRAEAKRHLPALFDRSWVCAITGCKDKSKKYSNEVHEAAYVAGRLAASHGFTVLTGGLSGVMSRAAEGARSVGGQTIGILPSSDHRDGNKNLDLVLPSGIGYARNFLVAAACDLMISLPGGTGTLEELCFAVDMEREVISWGGYEIEDVKRIALADMDALQTRLTAFAVRKFKEISRGQ